MYSEICFLRKALILGNNYNELLDTLQTHIPPPSTFFKIKDSENKVIYVWLSSPLLLIPSCLSESNHCWQLWKIAITPWAEKPCFETFLEATREQYWNPGIKIRNRRHWEEELELLRSVNHCGRRSVFAYFTYPRLPN